MTPKEVVSAIETRLGLLGEPVQLRDAIEHELLASGSSSAVAAEESDRLLGRAQAEIRLREKQRAQSGELPVLGLRGNGDTLVHGSSYVFGDDGDAIRTIKRNRASADDIRRSIIKLDFSAFEKFGARVLKEIGAHITKYTKHAGDQGIDFFGELSVGNLLNTDGATNKLLHETRLVIVGQAKHYPTRTIGPSTVRELVGALSLSRTATFSNDDVDLLDGVRLRPFTPVMAMLFSTGEFTKGARTLAERAGLIVFSGSQLAVFLADRGVGLKAVASGTQFDQPAFQLWLDTE